VVGPERLDVDVNSRFIDLGRRARGASTPRFVGLFGASVGGGGVQAPFLCQDITMLRGVWRASIGLCFSRQPTPVLSYHLWENVLLLGDESDCA
jgi:hypothetical protein